MTFRAPVYVACLLVLVVVGIALNRGVFDSAYKNASSGTDGLVSTAEPAKPVAVGSAEAGAASSQASLPQQLSNAGSGEAPQLLPLETHRYGLQASDPAVGPQPSHGSEKPTPSSGDVEAPAPDAVLGRPFPVSSSVRATCEYYSGSGGTDCGELYGLLARMAQEPRDPAWAGSTEAKLRHYLMTSEPGKYSIRALECRTSACAVEVEAAFFHGPFSVLSYEQAATLGLLRGDGMFGYESDRSSGEIRVRLETFERRY